MRFWKMFFPEEVEKVISTADILQFPDDDEFAAPTAFELRQSMRRSTRKQSSHLTNKHNNIYASSAAAASIRRSHALANAARAPPFTITPASAGIVPSIAYSDIGGDHLSEIYGGGGGGGGGGGPARMVNHGFVVEEDRRTTATTSRASSSLTEKPSDPPNHESSTDEVDDESATGTKSERDEEEEDDDQASSFVNHYANINNTLRRPWEEGTSESRRSRLPQPTAAGPSPPRPAYRKSATAATTTTASINGSIAGSDTTSVSLTGQLLYNNKAGSRAPLPGFSSFV